MVVLDTRLNDREQFVATGPHRRDILLGAGGLGTMAALGWPADAAHAQQHGRFDIAFDGPVLSRLRSVGDRFATEYLEHGQTLGHVALAFRRAEGAGPWVSVSTQTQPPDQTTRPDAQTRVATYTIANDGSPALRLTVRLAVEGDALVWQVGLENLSPVALEIGDVALPLPMNTEFRAGQPATAAVLKHSFVSGHGSFLFWMRSNSVGPYLMMMPERGTHYEYWQPRVGAQKPPYGPGSSYSPYRLFIHAAATAETMRAAGGRWRQPLTSVTLAPGQSCQFGSRFTWAHDYAAIRRRLVDDGGLDVEVAQGMTLPTDLSGRIALATRDVIDAIEAEFPDQTRITPLGSRNGRLIYDVRFNRLGENRLAVRHGSGRTTWLEFFATEPVETLYAKRAAFIAAHQHRDPSKWYNGLLAEWNMETGTLLGPDNYDRIKGWRIYEVTCDDPGLSKPAFLATKNAEFPVQAEVAALDYYVENFVWGGLQRTTEETDSFAIYGIPDWKQNRESKDPGPKGQQHYWRPYDYPHILVMYLGLYRIASRYPQITTRLDAATYLDRAAGTALAMFTIPLKIADWSAYETGFYNELDIPELIDALDGAGQKDKATSLRAHWVRKVDHFVNGAPDLFGSEYPFDSTGFESTQALARYALDHAGQPGFPIGARAAREFSDRQMQANLFCRGTIEPAYYYLGSDYRASAGDAFTLTYMAPMGGWAILDHAVNDAADPRPGLRLAFTSYLSAFAIINSGTADSDYGYWYPGLANDGACGGGFEPASHGMTWLDQPHRRGSWYYSCESDLGFCGAMRMAATLVSDDPVFGRFCFGGQLTETADGWLRITPRDGLRRRLHARLTRQSLDMEIAGDRFAATDSIAWHPDEARLQVTLEGHAQRQAPTLRLRGLPPGRYQLTGGGTFPVSTAASWVAVPLPSGQARVELSRLAG